MHNEYVARQGTCRLDGNFNATANSTALDGGLVIGYLRASSEHQWHMENQKKNSFDPSLNKSWRQLSMIQSLTLTEMENQDIEFPSTSDMFSMLIMLFKFSKAFPRQSGLAKLQCTQS